MSEAATSGDDTSSTVPSKLLTASLLMRKRQYSGFDTNTLLGYLSSSFFFFYLICILPIMGAYKSIMLIV